MTVNIPAGQLALLIGIVVVSVVSLAAIAVDLILTTPEYRDSINRNGLPRHDRVKGWWK